MWEELAMPSLTESFRLLEQAALGSFEPDQTVALAGTGQGHAGVQAAAIQFPAIELEPVFPGLEIVAKLAGALRRPADARRDYAEELAEERLNAITHALGLAFSSAAVAYMLAIAVSAGSWLRVASCGVYGATLVLMYAASTSLHAARKPRVKRRCQLCDHVSIYLLIAGTYTPFLAGLMQGMVGYSLLGCVWALAAAGIAIKVKNADRLGETSPLPCLLLGWLVVVAIKPLMAALPVGGIELLVAGGVSYSIGMLFYCRDDKRYFHAIWHLLVMAGTACHFAAVLLYVAL
jgi:hemolysin III